MGMNGRNDVNFGTPLFEHHLHGLITHLHLNLGARDTQYTISQRRSVPPREGLKFDELVAREIIRIELCGTFHPDISAKNVPRPMEFIGYRGAETDLRKIDGIKFETSPWYDERETPSEILEFMDRARGITEKYIRDQRLL